MEKRSFLSIAAGIMIFLATACGLSAQYQAWKGTITKEGDIAADNEGNIYALDLRDCCIKVFEASAKFLRKIGRRGQGPGELGGPFSMSLLSEKGEIFVHDVGNRKIAAYKTDGSYSRQMPVRGLVSQVKVDTSENIYTWVTDFGRVLSAPASFIRSNWTRKVTKSSSAIRSFGV